MNELSQKINKILKSNADTIRRYKEHEAKLIEKMRFCREHKFEEEERIAAIKYNEINMLVYDYNDMFNQILKAVNEPSS